MCSEYKISDADLTLVGAAPRHRTGFSVASGGDLDNDGFEDLVVGATGLNNSRGAAYVVLGPHTGEHSIPDTALRWDGMEAGDLAGYSAAIVGDANGDGVDDVVVGAPDAMFQSYEHAGAAYLLLGPITDSGNLEEAHAIWGGEATWAWAGGAVAGAGDMNGDGLDDILIGAITDPEAGYDAGAAYLLLGTPSGELSLANAEAKFLGEDEEAWAGYAVASAGDVNSDGHPDLLIGAAYQESGANKAGAVYLLLGPNPKSQSLTSADAILHGSEEWESTGSTLGCSGDVDGDGFSDLVIASDGRDSGRGAIHVVFGPAEGVLDLHNDALELLGPSSGSGTGSAVMLVDANGDGLSDILVGANDEDTDEPSAGKAFLLLAPISSESSLEQPDATFLGESEGDNVGGRFGCPGDLDGDGRSELILSASGTDLAGTDSGSVHVFRGGPAESE